MCRGVRSRGAPAVGPEGGRRRPAPFRARSGRGARGFTLVEVLVVVVLLGIIAMIAVAELTKISRRERLLGYSMQLTTLFQQAPLMVRQRDAVVFVRIGPVANVVTPQGTLPFRDVQLVADTCCGAAGTGNGSFDDPSLGATGDTVVQTVSLPMSELSLSTTALQPSIEQSNWSAGGTVDDTWVIGVNFRGQTITPNGAGVTGPALLALTHADMVMGSLKPLLNYQVQINPVWDVTVRRFVDGKVY
jgi:prepilin-type N-terminal cleavage/methylation domain-containing protein